MSTNNGNSGKAAWGAGRPPSSLIVFVLGALVALAALLPGSVQAQACTRTITANVVVFDQPTLFNRLGAQNPNFVLYALRRDVVATATGLTEANGGVLIPGGVRLRPDKRPRPLVLRSAAGDCLTVSFQNFLAPAANPNAPIQDNLIVNDQVADRYAGMHAQGVNLVGNIGSDGSMAGANPAAANCQGGSGPVQGSLVAPGGTCTYTWYTPQEGTFVINSHGATIGSEANAGNLGQGMFAQLNVEPVGAKFYRGQLTEEEMRLATTGTVASTNCPGVQCNPGGQPILDYEKLYPGVQVPGGAAACDAANTVGGVLDPIGAVFCKEGKAGLPVINMLTATNELVHSDINAIIVGPNTDGTFPASTYPLESVGKRVPNIPNRLDPFREFASIFHDEQSNSQVFPRWYLDPVLGYTLAGVRDGFMINYGSGGVGSEIIANRLHTGVMHDCTDCAYEEFFLASQTVGDPAMLVEFPANSGIEQCDPNNIPGTCFRDPINLANGPIAGNFALYQEDPSNVHHAYTGDHVKIRNIHAGANEQHIFHLHNHQWLFNPNDDNANYLDAQEIMPGSGHTYELANGGAGNRNKTVGDAIFHCHFYPHFAQGMWYHIRNHDVFEKGTVLAVSGANDPQNPTAGFHATPFALRSAQPAAGARALPDGELPDGSSIPALVPLPGRPMPPMPARVSVIAVDRGGFSLLGGRIPPNGIPDSAQAVVDRVSVAGPDTVLGTADDVSPGYPFWLAGNECGIPTLTNPCPQGVVGQRMPTPPLDMLTTAGATAIASQALFSSVTAAQAGGWDGGLPRHALLGYSSGGLSLDTQTRLDLSKAVERAQPVYFPETGTDLEKVAMATMAKRAHPSVALSLAGGAPTSSDFVHNGAPPVPGGPFNDPCIDDTGAPLTGTTLGQFFDGAFGLSTRGRSTFNSENPRTYAVANVQIDAVFNKVGYHFAQERIISLWGDVADHINKVRPPEPLVMRFNTFDCGKVLHSNLVPNEYALDDFQVRTPTDIIGQHIHLPKWDLTTGDGAANGWNYEDGSLSPGAVRERIHAINKFNAEAGVAADLLDLVAVRTLSVLEGADPGSAAPKNSTAALTEQPHPFFGNGVGSEYAGARTTIQRIFQDPIVNVAGVDRGLGQTFSHDHYGPSTFQQLGLYSSIITEPAGSTWRHNETGTVLGNRTVTGAGGLTLQDGGPTSWQAAVIPPSVALNGSTVQSETIAAHREFYFEFGDFQQAYEQGVYIGADAFGRPNGVQPTATTWWQAVNPSLKLRAGAFPNVVNAFPTCPGAVPRPCPEAINVAHGSMLVVNYRNEPVGLRVFDPNKLGPDGRLGAQAGGLNQLGVNVPAIAGDLAFALQTRTDRAIAALNTKFGAMPYPAVGTGDGINRDRRNGDPITPIMRAYNGDEVKVKIQSGATEEQHQVSLHGLKWLSNGSGFGRSPNSGWRNFQSDGISEQFSLQVPLVGNLGQQGNTADYLYATDVSRDGWWSGVWGVLRSYSVRQADLFQLPNNPQGTQPIRIDNQNDFRVVNGNRVCPNTAPVKNFNLSVVLANNALPNLLGATIPANTAPVDNAGGPLNPAGGTLVYNPRGTVVPGVTVPADGGGVITLPGGQGPLHDPTAMMYVHTADLNAAGQLLPGAPVEPAVLRVNAGDCVVVTVNNRLPAVAPDLAGWQDLMWVVNRELFVPAANRNPAQMSFFNNNLVRPSSQAALTPQLVEYDITRSDGTNVGINPRQTIDPGAAPGIYVWYAGDVQQRITAPGRAVLIATPVEFGAFNLLSPDKVKQPQKGLFAALVVEPRNATWTTNDTVVDRQNPANPVPRRTNANVTVTAPAGVAGSGGTYREALVISHKIGNFRWKDGSAVTNVKQGELGREGAEDAGHAGINYAAEPAWFRFKLPPDVPFGNAGTPNSFGGLANAHMYYSNALAVGEPNTLPNGDPATPVFTATRGQATRMYLLNGAATDRDSAFVLHGHVWQRDPFVCTGTVQNVTGTPIAVQDPQDPGVALTGRCAPNAGVPSMALGVNPQGKAMSSEEGMGHNYGHWPILFSAGGSGAIGGDYLFRDYAPMGNANGMWGILRVQ